MKRFIFTLLLLITTVLHGIGKTLIDGIFYETKYGKATVVANENQYSGDIEIPSKIVIAGSEYLVTAIGDNAFQYCKNLSTITIPNTVESIGRDAFMGCTGLTSVTIPNSVTSIGDRAFAECI